ncbi:MAG: lipoate--protein ligase family protein [Parachlamydiales bacterium]|jgi:lipoate-protein ligase A
MAPKIKKTLPPIRLLVFQGLEIFRQLEIEETLLKKLPGSFCLINQSTRPAIVLGLSSQKKTALNLPLLKEKPLALCRRFSGGGTIVVDENTFLVSFIIEKKRLNFNFPEEVFKWSENFYRKVFNLKAFSFKENDYLINNQKCGGNAQYFTREKWLHHTSFLFDFRKELQDYLLLPEKRPAYRQDRPHETFLIGLKNYFTPELFFFRLQKALKKAFCCQTFSDPADALKML